MGCCDILNKVIDPIRQKMSSGSSWADIIAKCYASGVDLSAKYRQVYFDSVTVKQKTVNTRNTQAMLCWQQLANQRYENLTVNSNGI